MFIIAYVCLIFVACGYKANPFYELKDENATVIDKRVYQDLNRW